MDPVFALRQEISRDCMLWFEKHGRDERKCERDGTTQRNTLYNAVDQQSE